MTTETVRLTGNGFAPSPGTSTPDQTIVHYGARPIVQVLGRVDRAAISQIRAAIRGLRAAGARHLVVDLSAVTDCDERLLNFLAGARAQLLDDRGTLTLAGVNLPQLLPALRETTVDGVFVVYDALRRERRSSIPPESPHGLVRR